MFRTFGMFSETVFSGANNPRCKRWSLSTTSGALFCIPPTNSVLSTRLSRPAPDMVATTHSPPAPCSTLRLQWPHGWSLRVQVCTHRYSPLPPTVLIFQVTVHKRGANSELDHADEEKIPRNAILSPKTIVLVPR